MDSRDTTGFARLIQQTTLGAVLIAATSATTASTLTALDAISHSALISATTLDTLERTRPSNIASTFLPGTRSADSTIVSPRELLSGLALASLLQPDGFSGKAWSEHRKPDVRRASPATKRGSDRFIIAIDPGHGGSDPGAKGENGLLEKHLTLDIAKRVKQLLSDTDGVDVVLTRSTDHGLSRGDRVAAIRKSNADLFFSLHFNHLPQRDLTLVESYFASPTNIAESRAHQRAQHLEQGHIVRAATRGPSDVSFTRGSERFAKLAQSHVYREVSRDNPDAQDAGVKQDTLFVLTRSYTAGSLIELTCLSNADEADRLADETYRERLAIGLANAVRDYLAQLESHPLDGTDT